MFKIEPGVYKVSEILARAKFDFNKQAAADYNDGKPDYRRVQIGGVGFSDLEETVRIPVTADQVEVTLDGKVVSTLAVDLKDEHHREREVVLEAAVEDPRHPGKTQE
jgi:hypothetical protein